MSTNYKKPRYGLGQSDKVCSICGKKFIVLNRGGYLYKRENPTRYQCSEKCWRIAKGEIKK